MSRPKTLTDQERIDNKKNLDSIPITLNVNSVLNIKIDKFSKKFKSRNKSLIYLISTHPDFLKEFPKNTLTLKK